MEGADGGHAAKMSRESSSQYANGEGNAQAEMPGQSSCTELEQALSKVSLEQQRKTDEFDEGDVRLQPSLPESSGSSSPTTSRHLDVGKTTPQPAPIDTVLVDAMRVPRDKVFVVQQERDMEEKIKDDSVQEWDLPLMNSYHRLLVHRIAEHFHLSHTLDPVSKQVTLTKTHDSRIPPMSIATLAENERLSEPLTGHSTPSSTVGMLAGGVRIMRRPDGTTRSDSPRNGTSTPDGARRDRRNMTIEEREAAYQEARQRIFGREGSVEGASTSVADQELEAQGSVDVANGSLRRESRMASSSSARSVTPSISGTSDSGPGSILRAAGGAGEEDRFSPTSETMPPAHFDPAAAGLMRQAMPNPYAYPSPADQQQATAYYNHGGGYPAGAVQFDAQGRPMMFMVMGSGPQWPYAPYPYPNGQPIHYGHNTPPMMGESVQSTAASSRSTSLSAGTKSAESARSSFSEQASQQNSQAPMSNTASHQGTPNRSQSVSPTATYPQQTQQRLASPPVSQAAQGPQGYMPQNPGPAWPLAYMHPSAAQGYPAQQYNPPSPMDFSGAMRSGLMRPMNSGMGPMSGKAVSSPPLPTHVAQGATDPRFGPGLGRASPQTPMMQQGGVAGNEYGQASASAGGGSSRGRGRLSQGSERTLFDPNKPSNSTTANSQAGSGTGRHSLGKSSSAAAVLENGLGTTSQSRIDGLPMTPTSLAALPGARLGGVTSAQGSRSGGSATATSVRGMHSSSSFVAPVHPSLPARPDWAVAARQASFGQNNASFSSSSSGSGNIHKTSNAGEAPGAQTNYRESDLATSSSKHSDAESKGKDLTIPSASVENEAP